MPVNTMITAFGETKRASKWVQDSRCNCIQETLCNRIQWGWNQEEAITAETQKKVSFNPKQAEQGSKFGYFTLTGTVKSIKNQTCVEAVCICGKKSFWRFSIIRRGKIKSCGCMLGAAVSAAIKTHGLSRGKNGNKTTLYSIWTAMKYRCTRERDKYYYNYGGRGIMVCGEWLNDFMSFFNWSISNGWVKGLTIDRINNDGNYEPSNCRWITIGEQQRNKRTSVILEIFGESKCVSEWAKDKRCLVKENTIRDRLRKGWSEEKAITTKSCR